MVWIKRNLSLVISGVLALGLLGFGGWYFWSALQQNNAVNGEIEQTKQEIERLLNMPVTPSPSNLNNAKRELDRVAQFNAAARKQFPPVPPPPFALTDESFKTLLQTTINDLHQQAARVGITVEPNYYFTFESHKVSLEFRPEILRPLYDRLQEVKGLASILLNARVNHILGFRRAAVPGEKGAGAAPVIGATGAGDYLNAPPRPYPDVGMVAWPYEVTFECFTSQLATVLEAVERMDQGFILKSFTSELAAVGMGSRAAAAQPPVDLRQQRFGGRTNVVPAAAASALTTVIDERLLRITLQIEVLRPDPAAGAGRGPGRFP